MSTPALDGLNDGKYENQLPYKEVSRDAYREEDRRLEALFRLDCAVEHGTVGHPREPVLWRLAWDNGHSGGYQEVYNWYADLSDILDKNGDHRDQQTVINRVFVALELTGLPLDWEQTPERMFDLVQKTVEKIRHDAYEAGTKAQTMNDYPRYLAELKRGRASR